MLSQKDRTTAAMPTPKQRRVSFQSVNISFVITPNVIRADGSRREKTRVSVGSTFIILITGVVFFSPLPTLLPVVCLPLPSRIARHSSAPLLSPLPSSLAADKMRLARRSEASAVADFLFFLSERSCEPKKFCFPSCRVIYAAAVLNILRHPEVKFSFKLIWVVLKQNIY